MATTFPINYTTPASQLGVLSTGGLNQPPTARDYRVTLPGGGKQNPSAQIFNTAGTPNVNLQPQGGTDYLSLMKNFNAGNVNQFAGENFSTSGSFQQSGQAFSPLQESVLKDIIPSLAGRLKYLIGQPLGGNIHFGPIGDYPSKLPQYKNPNPPAAPRRQAMTRSTFDQMLANAGPEAKFSQIAGDPQFSPITVAPVMNANQIQRMVNANRAQMESSTAGQARRLDQQAASQGMSRLSPALNQLQANIAAQNLASQVQAENSLRTQALRENSAQVLAAESARSAMESQRAAAQLAPKIARTQMEQARAQSGLARRGQALQGYLGQNELVNQLYGQDIANFAQRLRPFETGVQQNVAKRGQDVQFGVGKLDANTRKYLGEIGVEAQARPFEEILAINAAMGGFFNPMQQSSGFNQAFSFSPHRTTIG